MAYPLPKSYHTVLANNLSFDSGCDKSNDIQDPKTHMKELSINKQISRLSGVIGGSCYCSNNHGKHQTDVDKSITTLAACAQKCCLDSKEWDIAYFISDTLPTIHPEQAKDIHHLHDVTLPLMSTKFCTNQKFIFYY